MRPSVLLYVLAPALFVVACEPQPTAPSRVPGLEASSVSDASGDITYEANPPRVAVDPSTVIPDAIPFCKTSSGTLLCYPPSFIRAAYNFPSGLTGAGQTIVIVDAYGSPTIANDLALFDQVFKIPAPPSFTVLCPEGCPPFNPRDAHHGVLSWTIETSLDVEYAHAMAPGANIVLVVAATSSGDAINVAEQTAIARYPGSIMSQSFGSPEYGVHANNVQLLQAHDNYVAAQAAHITVLASAGDFGATNGIATANASFPASDTLVTAVGGTEGNPYPGGLLGCDVSTSTCSGSFGEQVWNEPAFGAAGGGAPSLLFGVPSFQNGLGLAARATPDISYNAAVNGGVLVVWSAEPPAGFFIVGGTSAGSPQWAAIAALANQLSAAGGHGPLGNLNRGLYALARSAAYSTDFHDVTTGNNRLVGTPVGFAAGTGWDDATGWGTPNVAALVPDLVKCVTTTSCP